MKLREVDESDLVVEQHQRAASEEDLWVVRSYLTETLVDHWKADRCRRRA